MKSQGTKYLIQIKLMLEIERLATHCLFYQAIAKYQIKYLETKMKLKMNAPKTRSLLLALKLELKLNVIPLLIDN